MSYDIDVAHDSFNYTWNMGPFFRHFEAYPHDWDQRTAAEVADNLDHSLGRIESLDINFLQANWDAPNKWGTVPTAIEFLKAVRDSCRRNPEAIVEVS